MAQSGLDLALLPAGFLGPFYDLLFVHFFLSLYLLLVFQLSVSKQIVGSEGLFFPNHIDSSKPSGAHYPNCHLRYSSPWPIGPITLGFSRKVWLLTLISGSYFLSLSYTISFQCSPSVYQPYLS
jgi:hypothetical protein